MNNIDKQFYELISRLKNLNQDELFYNIKNNFLALNEDMKTSLENYLNQFGYWGTLNHKSDDYTEIYEKATSFFTHLEDYTWLYENLEDYRSKKLLLAILKNWYYYDFNSLEASRELNFSAYFDLDIIKCKDEVFADLGAYNGDTTLEYIKTYGKDSYKKIYCFEITPDIFALLKNNLSEYENIEFIRKAVSDKIETMYIKKSLVDASANTVNEKGTMEIQTTTLDECIKEKITTIKMDIEGFEQRAILGAKRHIEKDKPKLLLSVYHNNEDLWKIPRMIDRIAPGYKFYLRNNGGGVFPTEITLIGIYDNKNIS